MKKLKSNGIKAPNPKFIGEFFGCLFFHDLNDGERRPFLVFEKTSPLANLIMTGETFPEVYHTLCDMVGGDSEQPVYGVEKGGQVYVKCPYCGFTHVHGGGGETHGIGGRAAHCFEKEYSGCGYKIVSVVPEFPEIKKRRRSY